MMFRLQRRESLVASGNNVLGCVPAEWQVWQMRALVTPRLERNQADLPLLSVARERGVFVRSDTDDNHNVVPDDLSNYKVAHEGDLVINKMKAWQGSLGLAPTDGIVSPAYFVLRLGLDNKQFGAQLLRSARYVTMLAAASDGVRVGQWDLDPARFRELPVLIPSREEQAAIVKYLGHAHARIDQAIAAKRKLIALLEEQKQAIILQAVIHGLDLDVPLKEAGIPWLGPVPAHWEIRRAKHLFSEFDRRSGTGQEPLLSLRLAQGLIRYADVSSTQVPSESLRHYKIVHSGDFVMNRMRAATGLFAVAGQTGLVSPDYATMHVGPHADSSYYLALFKTSPAMAEFRRRSTGLGTGGAGFMRLYFDEFGRIPLPLPPIVEQQAIAEFVSSHSIPKSFTTVANEIRLLQEFRSRLTSDVVTGQVDVREIASTLPDLTDEQLAEVDDASDVMEDDEELVEVDA